MKVDQHLKFSLLIQKDTVSIGDNLKRQFVLSDFAMHLTSQFGRSFSNHSYSYAFSNDQPNCFASYTAKIESFMKYPG
jgi:hypothetical protein